MTLPTHTSADLLSREDLLLEKLKVLKADIVYFGRTSKANICCLIAAKSTSIRLFRKISKKVVIREAIIKKYLFYEKVLQTGGRGSSHFHTFIFFLKESAESGEKK